MHEDFWQARWSRNEIGFHLNKVNPWLEQLWPTLQLETGTRVLVPLCGKSLDLSWLAGQGHAVLGVELAETAVRAFFTEHGLQPEISQTGAFTRYQSGLIELWCGDFFALTADEVANCRAFYDRAALIAMPAEMRERYAAHLTAILPGTCSGLLVTLDYAQEEKAGPPFAVSEAEVRRLFGAAWTVEWMAQKDVLELNWKYHQQGLTRLEEAAYRIRR
ncbi:thiopurine S-methyltransferase [Pseudomonas sp.]|jgi:thiopurine S-methyltransferase|uniref:thiopurine S-methyltransferase n=1 Tax=Pseudomonas sp. TaxID=306 RepID=UPI0019F835A8|nr:thiopurine S-methyltransferase [Pseudomonas sp.]MBF0674213.1 thiopurine S-methyltransferase [Pseudomonas sp.]